MSDQPTIQEYQVQIRGVIEELKELKMENKRLQDFSNENQELKKSNQKLIEDVQKWQYNYNNAKATQESFKNKYEDLQREFDYFKEQNKNTKNLIADYENIKKLNQTLRSQQNEAEESLQMIKNLCNQYDLGKIILEQYEKKIEQKKLDQNGNQKEEEQNERAMQIDNMQGYDLQIKFDSVKKLLSDGADISLKFTEQSSTYQNFLSKNVHLISFLGLKNAGKSFWHSKLSGQNIKQGQLHATQGLNINFTENYWYLDSPGLGETLQNFSEVYEDYKEFQVISKQIDEKANNDQNESNNQEQIDHNQDLLKKKQALKNKINEKKKKILNNQNELYKEKLAIEYFVQQYILQNSDIIFYVCDILSLEEQRYITQISQNLQKNGKNQKLIVCHNFKTINKISEFQQCIEKDIYKNFSIEFTEKIDLNSCFYKDFSTSQSDKDNKESNVTHIVFGKEGSEVETVYNQRTIDYVDQLFKNYSKQGNQKNFFDSFVKYCNEHIEEFIIWKKLKFDNNNDENVPKPRFEVDYASKKILSIDHQILQKESLLCKDILTNFLGQKINSFDNGENSCFYQVYQKSLPKGKFLKTVLLSLPAFNLIKEIKVKQYPDQYLQKKLLKILIKYDEQQIESMRERCITDGSNESNDFLNNQQLQYGKISLNIPMCDLAFNAENDGEFKSLKPQRMDDYSMYIINFVYNNGENSGSDSDW